METDAETHNQTLDGAWKILWKRERRILGARGAKEITRKPTESTKLGSSGLTKTELPTRDLAWNCLRPLRICYSSVALSFCASPSSGLCCLFWGPFPPGLSCPALIAEEGLILIAAWSAMAAWYTGKASPFLKRKDERWMGWGWKGGWGMGLSWEEEGEMWLGWV